MYSSLGASTYLYYYVCIFSYVYLLYFMFVLDTSGGYHFYVLFILYTLSSAYNEVAFNEQLATTKENLCTKYFPLTVMLETPPIRRSLYEIATYNDFLSTEFLPFASINEIAYYFSGDACRLSAVCVVFAPR